jgi:uncharacterized phage protein (TIGR01671 family)
MRDMGLYRGKRVDNGEWEYGALIVHNERAYIYPDKYFTAGMVGFCEVDPATIGQFTGRCDRRGKRAYQGDIVKGSWPYAKTGVITWDESRCGFYIQPTDGLGKAAYDKGYKMNGALFEVIGNVHDHDAKEAHHD